MFNYSKDLNKLYLVINQLRKFDLESINGFHIIAQSKAFMDIYIPVSAIQDIKNLVEME